MQELKFSVNFEIPPDRKWGNQNPDGSWDGMVGMLSKGEVDFAATGFSVTDARNEVMDYSPSLIRQPCKLYIQKPGQALNWYTFLLVYSHNVWFSIVITLFGQAIVFYLFHKYANIPFHEPGYIKF